jgi:hypothetical protein
MNTKKFLGIIAAAVLILGFAGQSMAAMTNNQLYRIVYTTTGTVEAITDLGTIGGEINLSAQGTIVGGGTAAFNRAQFGTGTEYNNLRVAYFASNNTSSTDYAWATGNTTRLARGISQYQTGFSATSNYYSGLTEGHTLLGDKDTQGSYYRSMDFNGTTLGSFNGLSATGLGEVSLGALATTGYTDQTLYYFTSLTSGVEGVPAAMIRTMANGSTIVNPNPVPVPPGVFLLAPGLLGLIGLRKRFANR